MHSCAHHVSKTVTQGGNRLMHSIKVLASTISLADLNPSPFVTSSHRLATLLISKSIWRSRLCTAVSMKPGISGDVMRLSGTSLGTAWGGPAFAIFWEEPGRAGEGEGDSGWTKAPDTIFPCCCFGLVDLLPLEGGVGEACSDGFTGVLEGVEGPWKEANLLILCRGVTLKIY